ncbi:MAG: Thioredoxin reductase [Microgenomates group bacterium GW2011_GWB1_46_7]|nr:MAG: Thioredoxin reductase [Microgenomates group bacterium GW2011_GWB1_46_7]
MNNHKIAIVGSGPAGLAAAIYTSRAEIETTVYAGMEPGGQLTKTSEIENYPGVVGKTGPELMLAMTEQATKFGAKLVYEAVSDLGKLQSQYDAVILAMGAAPRMLGIGEEKYYGKGLSTCAVCDAAFYKGKRVYVVGGGDAAIEDAWALTKFASSVTMLVRGDKFRASIAMQKRVTDNPDKIKVKWQASLRQIIGDRVQTLVLEVKGKEETVPAEGIFLAIGHVPATGWLSSSGINLDSEGYIIVGEGEIPTMTNKTGVFAAGDCVDKRYRQAATAAGMGVAAALDAERWLARNESVV